MTLFTTPPEHATTLDRLYQAWQARFTGGLSPASLLLAYMDWLVHLGNSPGSQARLIEHAWCDALQFAACTARSADSQAVGIVLGARVPIMLTSRADNPQAHIASRAIALLLAHSKRKAKP